MTAYVDNQTVEGLTSTLAYSLQITTQATANSTLTLSVASTGHQQFTGTTAGQIVKMPVATTLLTGHEYWIINDSTKSITIQNNSAGTILTLEQTRRCKIVLKDNSTAAGVWIVVQVAANTNPVGGLFIAYFASTANSNSGNFLSTYNIGTSDNEPAVIPITGSVVKVTVTLNGGTGSGTFEFRINTTTGTAAFTAVMVAQKSGSFSVNYPVVAGDTVNCKVATGASGIAKPLVNIYM